MNIFVWKLSKIAAQKKVFFSLTFSLLRYRLTVFCPHFRMSNIFRDSESLGKSNGKKWSNIWTSLFRSGLKSPRKKKVFFLLILPWSTLLWHRCYYPHRSRDALSPVCGIFTNHVWISQSFNDKVLLRTASATLGLLKRRKNNNDNCNTYTLI